MCVRVCVYVCVRVCVHFVSFLFDCFFDRYAGGHFPTTHYQDPSLKKNTCQVDMTFIHSFFLLVTFFLAFLSLILIVIYSFCQLFCKFYLFMQPQIQLLFQLIVMVKRRVFPTFFRKEAAFCISIVLYLQMAPCFPFTLGPPALFYYWFSPNVLGR
jgi:hypothetical protein